MCMKTCKHIKLPQRKPSRFVSLNTLPMYLPYSPISLEKSFFKKKKRNNGKHEKGFFFQQGEWLDIFLKT